MSIRQKFIRNLAAPAHAHWEGDWARFGYLREFERTQFLPLSGIHTLQLERLQSLLEHAYRQCPFYREAFDRIGLTPGDLKTLQDLHAFPILEKNDIQNQRDRMVARNWPRDDLIANYTGGSTGAPLSFYLSHDRRRSRWAATIRHNRWAGWDIGDKVAYLWGALNDIPMNTTQQYLRQILLEPQIFLNTAKLTEETLHEFNSAMKRFRPRVVLAYSRSAVLFARYLQARGLSAYQPIAIVTSAEVLEPEDRSIIEGVFGCPVFNRYGCREVSVIASECAAHNGLHVMVEGLYLETVSGGKPAGPGETGEILVTDLMNLAMPLIRYRIGDVGSFAQGPCACGRSLPRLAHVQGRATDFLVARDGHLVSGPFLTLAAVGKRPSLGQLQIHQDTIGQVKFRIVRGPRFQDLADLDFLREVAQEYLGAETKVEWEFVDEIPSTPSGKFLFCRSSVTPGFLNAPTTRGEGHEESSQSQAEA